MRISLLISLLLVSLLGSGCSRLFGPEEAPPEAPTPTTVAVPTFTPTPDSGADSAMVPTPEPATESATQAVAVATEAPEETEAPVTLATLRAQTTEPVSTTVPAASTPGESTPTASVDAAAETSESGDSVGSDSVVVVAAEIINVRSGPSTEYEIIGSVSAGEQYPARGRNEAGDWWQVCCFGAEQPGWLYGALIDVQNGESVALASDIPPLPTATATQAVALTPTSEPAAEESTVEEPAVEEPAVEEPAVEEPAAEEASSEPTPAPVAETTYDPHSSTAGNFDPNAQFQIVHYHVRGFDENNGGIFNNGGQHMIFITVLDENGAGIDGAVVKDALADDLSITTGSKGPGKAEFEMFWEPYKLYVESIPSGPVTSQVSNQMNTAKPHIPDIVGIMGPPENEYAICPTIDDRCEPPFFHAHWSYEITFQKVQ